MSKVTVIGAGNVGATCANNLAIRKIASEIVLLDIKEGLAEGKMLDVYQTSALMDFDVKVVGATGDYAASAGSDVVVITSGVPRKPGMSREELIGVNAGIVKGVMAEAMKHSPRAIFVIVSNPMDTMTYLALRTSGLPSSQVFGMGGQLDSARFRCYLAKALGASMKDVDGMVIGGHGDTTMIPLTGRASWRGVQVSQLLPADVLAKISADTMVGGATLTALLGTSAWYAPGAAAASVVEAIMFDQKKIIPSCVSLNGEYGQRDICIGVPAVIGRGGVERIVELELTPDEAALFAASASAVRKTNDVLHEIGAL